MDLDVHWPFSAWRDGHALDKGAELVEEFVARLAVANAVEMATQLADDSRVVIGSGRVQCDGVVVIGKAAELIPELIAFPFHLAEPRGESGAGGARDNGVNKAFDAALDFCELAHQTVALGLLGGAQRASRDVVLGHVGRDHLWLGQIALHGS